MTARDIALRAAEIDDQNRRMGGFVAALASALTTLSITLLILANQ